MPTFSSDQFNAFKDAFSSVTSHFFSVFTEIINWIRSSPVVFYAVALPIGGAVFVLVFLFVRSLVDRDYSGSLGEAPMWGRELSGSMTGAALMMRKLYRSRGKVGKGKGKGSGKNRSSGRAGKPRQSSNSSSVSSDDLYSLFGVTPEQMREFYRQNSTQNLPYNSKLDISADDDDL